MKCLKCGNTLVRIGSGRTGGRILNNHTGDDWGTRKYHKKCWKELREESAFDRLIAEQISNNKTDLKTSQ